MSQSNVTLNEIMTTVRELTFDRFIVPAFAVKANPGFTISVTPTKGETVGSVEIKNAESSEQNRVFSFSDYKTMEELMNAFIEAEIVVAYTPYFIGGESVDSLIKVTDRSLDEDFTAFRRYFFTNEEIESMIKYYYLRVLDIPNVKLTDEIVALLKRPSEKHLAIWVSYYMVDRRRMYEAASNAIGQTFTDGSDYAGSSVEGMGNTTTVQIGSVFSITEDPTRGYFYEDYNRVGSDNLWGDRYSFWYKLMLYLRDLLETQFGDFSLRKDNVIPGYICLTRELDFRSYYDSYPFTLSPLSRGILSKTP